MMPRLAHVHRGEGLLVIFPVDTCIVALLPTSWSGSGPSWLLTNATLLQ